MTMNINGLLRAAEKNKFIPTQKRFSLEFSPAKKLPKSQVNPDAIRALIEKKEREKQDERANLISKAVQFTKRDEINYKDRHGIRKADQEKTEKCKKQWQKVQKERREFIEHMHSSADKKNKRKKDRDSNEILKSIKQKEQDSSKRKRKYEPFAGSTESAKKVKYTPIASPKVTDINELMRMAQKNAEDKSFGAIVNPLREIERKQPAVEEHLLRQSEKNKLEEQEAFSKKRDFSFSRIRKVCQSSDSNKLNEQKKRDEKDNRRQSIKSNKDKDVSRKKSYTGPRSSSSSRNSNSVIGDGKEKQHFNDKEKHRSSHNGPQSTKSNGASKSRVPQSVTAACKLTPVPNGNLGKAQNGDVSLQSTSSSAKEKLRQEIAEKLAQLQKERQAEEEAERRKRLQAKKARMAQEEALKKKLKALRQSRSRLVSEDEDDFEEDLDEYEDDFIDDGPIDDPYAKGYSQHIREIFKYDKSKYRDVDDDDIEESSFTRCMAEEARSSRLGREEDLEDMRKEAEDLQRKSSRFKALKALSEKVKHKNQLTLCPV